MQGAPQKTFSGVCLASSRNSRAPARPADDEDLVEPGDDRRGAERHDRLGEAGDRHLRAFDVQMAVDHAGAEIVARGVDDLRFLDRIIGDLADGHDAIAVDGDVGR